MPMPSSGQLLRRHVAPFAVALTALTAFMLVRSTSRLLPQLSTGGTATASSIEVLLLSLPFTLALTIPMAVFIAVSWVFTRLGAEGVLAEARRERHGTRRLLAPVFGAAVLVAAVTLLSNTLVTPRANTRLGALYAVAFVPHGDRMMTVGELREAARAARAEAVPAARARAAAYEVEIHKKFALAVASLVLALAGAALPLRFPGGGGRLVFAASVVVFSGYYASLTAGESLADRQALSPGLAMWTANALLLVGALWLGWRPHLGASSPDLERAH